MGVKAPKYKKFDTREAAEEWLQGFGAGGLIPAPFKEEDADEEDELEEDASPAVKKIKLASDEIAVMVQDELDDDLLEIYTDGSTLANGQNGAVAGVGVFFGDGDPRFVNTLPPFKIEHPMPLLLFFVEIMLTNPQETSLNDCQEHRKQTNALS